jgi:hypothetical protein
MKVGAVTPLAVVVTPLVCGQGYPLGVKKAKSRLIPEGGVGRRALPLNHGQGKAGFRYHQRAKCVDP